MNAQRKRNAYFEFEFMVKRLTDEQRREFRASIEMISEYLDHDGQNWVGEDGSKWPLFKLFRRLHAEFKIEFSDGSPPRRVVGWNDLTIALGLKATTIESKFSRGCGQFEYATRGGINIVVTRLETLSGLGHMTDPLDEWPPNVLPDGFRPIF